jgi:hypothetical protein
MAGSQTSTIPSRLSLTLDVSKPQNATENGIPLPHFHRKLLKITTSFTVMTLPSERLIWEIDTHYRGSGREEDFPMPLVDQHLPFPRLDICNGFISFATGNKSTE